LAGSQKAHYWIKRFVNVIGPIPVVAYTPIAIVPFTTTFWQALVIAITHGSYHGHDKFGNQQCVRILITKWRKQLGAMVKYLNISKWQSRRCYPVFLPDFSGVAFSIHHFKCRGNDRYPAGLGWYVGHGMSAYVMVIILVRRAGNTAV